MNDLNDYKSDQGNAIRGIVNAIIILVILGGLILLGLEIGGVL